MPLFLKNKIACIPFYPFLSVAKSLDIHADSCFFVFCFFFPLKETSSDFESISCWGSDPFIEYY